VKRKSKNVEFLQLPENARARALQRAMGYTSEDLKRPRIGIANTWGETSPGHIHLRAVADAVKAGVWQAGGTPFEFNSFAMCPMDVGRHGIRYDTPTRDIIAAAVEASTHLHLFDALVLISSCDKNVPAHLLAAARLGIPAILVPGGPMDAGRYDREDLDTTSIDRECWAFGAGVPRVSPEDLRALEDHACPGAGSCALLGTANTMQCLSEALGLTLPGGGTALATSARRLWIAKESGRQIVRLWEEGLKATDILTAKGLKNAIHVLHAIGGSTNAIVHLLALAYELGMEGEINLALMEALGRETPCITDVRPSGPYTLRDFDEAGGVPAVMKTIEDRLDVSVPTVTGRTLGENLSKVPPLRSPVIRDLDHPIAENGLAVLQGSLCDSAVIRPTVIPPEMRTHEGPAVVFDGQEAAIEGLKEGKVHKGDVVVVRYEGPQGGPGLTEVFKVIGYMKALGLERDCALVTDGKISGFAQGPFICQITPEAALGGPLALVQDGDVIAIDISNRSLDLKVNPEEMSQRKESWRPPAPRVKRGFLTLYTRLALPATRGAGLDLTLKNDRILEEPGL